VRALGRRRREAQARGSGPATTRASLPRASDGVQDDGVQGEHARYGRSCSAAATSGSAREQWSRAWRMSEAVEEKAANEIRRHCELLVEDMEVAWCEQTTALAEAEGRLWRCEPEGKAAKRRRRPDATSSKEPRCSQARRAPFVYAEVGTGATRKTGDGGRPALMESQPVERAAELQDPEVRTELNRRVRECEQKCSAGGRLDSIPQASVRARQQATREQVEGQWYEIRTGTARRRCDQAWRSCRRLRGCVDRVSAAHAREQRRLSP
jgi:hypothetical protein